MFPVHQNHPAFDCRDAEWLDRPRAEILGKLSETRRPSYAEAHIHVTSGNGSHADVVEAIVAALKAHLETPPCP